MPRLRPIASSRIKAAVKATEDAGKCWQKRKPKWPWRDFLTDEEREILRKADEAKAVWESLNRERAKITNRAINRSKYHAARPDGGA